jgi:hypothetical protein
MSRNWAILVCLLLVSGAQAATVTFDDVTTDVFAEVPNGYGGLNWSNVYVIDPVADSGELPPESGYRNGIVSGGYVAYDGLGTTATVAAGSFNFNSVYLTAAWYNDLLVQVDGYAGGVLKYSQTVTVQPTAPTLFTFDYLAIDSLVFTPSEGTEAGYEGGGQMFVMDDFTFAKAEGVIPLPSAFPAGLALLGGAIALKSLRYRSTRR